MDAWRDAVVIVRQGGAFCAGVRTSADEVLTAYHCVASGGRPQVEDRAGRRIVGRVVGVDPRHDLARIALREPLGAGFLAVAEGPPAVGDAVTAIGHPSASRAPGGFFEGTLRWSVGVGEVAAIGERALQVTVPLNPGNSGGPILDANGAVVGIVSRRLGGQSLGFAGRPERFEARRPGPLGGTVAGELVVATHEPRRADAVSAGAAGARLEVAFRDRVLVDGAAFLPFSGNAAAMRFGRTSSSLLDLRTGVRARFGRGSWTLATDLLLGVTAIRTIRADDTPLDLVTTTPAVAQLAGVVRLGGIGLELAALPDAGLARLGVSLRVPGVISVF